MTKIVFDEEQHIYTVGGVKVPSVTDVLKIIDKPGLIYWAINQVLNYFPVKMDKDAIYTVKHIEHMIPKARKEPDKVRQIASSRGKIVHKWVENYIKGEDTEIPKGYGGYKDGFLSWIRKNEMDLLESEVIVYNKKRNVICQTT